MRLDLELGVATVLDTEVGDTVSVKVDASNPDVVEYYVNGVRQTVMEESEVRELIVRLTKRGHNVQDQSQRA